MAAMNIFALLSWIYSQQSGDKRVFTPHSWTLYLLGFAGSIKGPPRYERGALTYCAIQLGPSSVKRRSCS